jgi:hypothetical protein
VGAVSSELLKAEHNHDYSRDQIDMIR